MEGKKGKRDIRFFELLPDSIRELIDNFRMFENLGRAFTNCKLFNSVAICDDVIVSGSHDNTVKVWSLKSGECLKTLEGHSEIVFSVAICDDVIVSGSYDKTVKA